MPSTGNPSLPFRDRHGDFKAAIWAMESGFKNFRAKLIAFNGETYYALVKAEHFASAYAKAKQIAREEGYTLGVIVQL